MRSWEAWIRVEALPPEDLGAGGGHPRPGRAPIIRQDHDPQSNSMWIALLVDSNGRILVGWRSSSRSGGGDPISLNRWYHVGFVFGEGEPTDIYLDGEHYDQHGHGFENEELAGYDVFVGSQLRSTCVDCKTFVGSVDEVLLHTVRKSPAYFRARTAKGPPVVRFLAHTLPGDEAGHPYRSYHLRWGDRAATRQHAITRTRDGQRACSGLQTECTGHLLWWRFDDPWGVGFADEP